MPAYLCSGLTCDLWSTNTREIPLVLAHVHVGGGDSLLLLD